MPLAPFDRLQKLGEERFTQILNALQRGEPAMALARTIQLHPPDGWGLFQDVAEKTLTQQLLRLREAATQGAFGLRAAKRIAEGAAPRIKRLEHVSVKALDRLEELAEKQRTLSFALMDEALANKKTYMSTNDAVEGYHKVLLSIQKIRFELGLDEYKGPTATLKGASQTTTFPDGTSVNKQVFEAVNTIERIFDARKIPRLQ